MDPAELDRRAVRAAFERAAADYDGAAQLQAEIETRLLERLELTDIAPARILDLGTGTGRALRPLARSYRSARLVAADFAMAMLAHARRRRPWFRGVDYVCAAAGQLPFAPASFDLVFSNLTLQWCPRPLEVYGELRRVLAERSLLLFSTFGPDTLRELRAAWAEVDGYNHVNRFLDMHDIGDALVRAGFAEPVVDVEHLTVTYADVRELMRDLKSIGAHNVSAGRPRGLTGPRRLAAVAAAYERFRGDGRLPATYEVVYGTAWTPIALPRR